MVELAIALPVAIIVAVIAVNALLFFSECSQFDRAARQAVRVYASSPQYGVRAAQASAQIQTELEAMFNESNLSVQVGVSSNALGYKTYTATLEFAPTLFGLGLQDEIFGIALPKLKHAASLTVDTYRPGVFL